MPAGAVKYAQDNSTGSLLVVPNLLGARGCRGRTTRCAPFPPSHRPYASGRVWGCVRGGFGAFVAVGLVRHAPKGVGWVLLTRISRLTRRSFCCCCCCTGPRRSTHDACKIAHRELRIRVCRNAVCHAASAPLHPSARPNRGVRARALFPPLENRAAVGFLRTIGSHAKVL